MSADAGLVSEFQETLSRRTEQRLYEMSEKYNLGLGVIKTRYRGKPLSTLVERVPLKSCSSSPRGSGRNSDRKDRGEKPKKQNNKSRYSQSSPIPEGS